MEEIEIIEEFEHVWPRLPKNCVEVNAMQNGESELFFACELGRFRLLTSVIIGKRKGLREQVTFYDPEPAIVIDRLVLAAVSTDGPGNVIREMRDMRAAVRRGGDPNALCREQLEKTLDSIRKTPDAWIGRLRAASLDDTYQSIRGFEGGLPSLGRSSR